MDLSVVSPFSLFGQLTDIGSPIPAPPPPLFLAPQLVLQPHQSSPSIERLYRSGWNDSSFFFGCANTYVMRPSTIPAAHRRAMARVAKCPLGSVASVPMTTTSQPNGASGQTPTHNGIAFDGSSSSSGAAGGGSISFLPPSVSSSLPVEEFLPVPRRPLALVSIPSILRGRCRPPAGGLVENEAVVQVKCDLRSSVGTDVVVATRRRTLRSAKALDLCTPILMDKAKA